MTSAPYPHVFRAISRYVDVWNGTLRCFVSTGIPYVVYSMHQQHQNDTYQITSIVTKYEPHNSCETPQTPTTDNFITKKNFLTYATSSSDDLDENNNAYHTSLTGGILLVSPDVSKIFDYAEHGNFEGMNKVLQVHHTQAVQMKNEKEQTLLHVAVIFSFSYVWIRLLLMRESNPCAQDKDGYTPLHYAVEKDDVEMVKALTARFCIKLNTLPDAAIDKIHADCMRALTVTDKLGRTVFMLACYKGSLKCATYLNPQQTQDNFNMTDIYGDTSLHYAVARDDKYLTEMLLTGGKADVNGGELTRPSALDVAIFNQNSKLTELLLTNKGKSRCFIKRKTQNRTMFEDDLNLIIKRLPAASCKEEKQQVDTVNIDSSFKALESQHCTSATTVAEVVMGDDTLGKQATECDKTTVHQITVKNCHSDYASALIHYEKAIDIVEQLSLSLHDYVDIPDYYANRALIHAIHQEFDSA
ncbi:unnamed protein product, partial [Didymodactylos carnosus]